MCCYPDLTAATACEDESETAKTFSSLKTTLQDTIAVFAADDGESSSTIRPSSPASRTSGIEPAEASRGMCQQNHITNSFSSCSSHRIDPRGHGGGHGKVRSSQNRLTGHRGCRSSQSPSSSTTSVDQDSRLTTHFQGAVNAVGKKIKLLSPRITALEDHFDSPPGDEIEQKRQTKLRWYVLLPLVVYAFVYSFQCAGGDRRATPVDMGEISVAGGC